jgi:AcrR family transcriptional regulator
MLTVPILDDIDNVKIKFGDPMSRSKRASRARPYHHGDLRRSLIEAALDLVTQEQDWTFSLREVARRAGVSHNAPYNHFSDKQDLLLAVAAAGFERLRDNMRAAAGRIAAPEKALLASGRAYLQVALDNPALYRLMFGPALAKSKGARPAAARAAGNDAKSVLAEIILRGARSGAFAISPDDPKDQAKVIFFVWSVVHGLTMLLLDDFAEAGLTIDDLVEEIERVVLKGLRPRRF